MFKGKERVVQLSGNRLLTNYGRVFELTNPSKGLWEELELPQFTSQVGYYQQPKGQSKFLEPISAQEKFDKANNIGDLL